MRVYVLRSLIIVAALVLAPVSIALAHGEPVIAVEPGVVPAGGTITVTGSEMEPGEVFVLTLEGPTGSIPLGEATATGEGGEGGFVTKFVIPANVAPGSYTVRAATEEGEAAVADLTVTAPSAEASAGPATVQQATGEPHVLDRGKPMGQVAGVVLLIALSAVLGFVLVRSREGATSS